MRQSQLQLQLQSPSPPHMPSESLPRNNRSMEERIQTKLRSTKHGMGAFADGLMRSVVVESYRPPSPSFSSSFSSSSTTTKSPSQTKARLILSFSVTQELCNSFDSLHGGAQATAVDVFTSVLLGIVHPVPSVTADLHVSCLSPAPLGSTIACVCEVDRSGGRLQFASCDLYRVVDAGESGDKGKTRWDPVTKGLHTKYVVQNRTKRWTSDREGGSGTLRSKL